MPELYLLRHGECHFSPEGDIFDPGLTLKGQEQAEALSSHYELVICSPLTRARQTLEHSNITYDKLIICPEAREVRNNDKRNYLPEENQHIELEQDFIKRCLKLKRKVLEYTEVYKTVLVISHCMTLFYLTALDETGDIHANGINLEHGQLVKVQTRDIFQKPN